MCASLRVSLSVMQDQMAGHCRRVGEGAWPGGPRCTRRVGGLLAMIVCLLLARAAVAQTYYVRQGAAGASDGSDWTNAFTDLPSNLVRGATYYHYCVKTCHCRPLRGGALSGGISSLGRRRGRFERWHNGHRGSQLAKV